jgi:hypothetical protein
MSQPSTVRSIAVLGTVLLAAPLAAQEAPPAGPVLKTGAAEIQIGGRVQTQFNTTSVESEPTSEFLLRRVRLEATVKINDVVSGKVQPDFAGNRVSLKDAYLKLDFAPALQLLAGQAYRPFSLLEQTSSTRILPIERGLEIRGLDAVDEYELVHGLAYSDRDIGVQVMGAPAGAPLGLTYQAGVFRGPLQGAVGAEDSRQYAARLTVRPAERLRVGAAWSSRDFARPEAAVPDAFELRRGHAFEVDVEYGAFAPGVHLLAEAAWGDRDPFTGAKFSGAQAWLGYRTPALGEAISGVEPLLRVSHGRTRGGEPGTPRDGGTLLTPGVNLYLGGLNRLMLNYDAWLPREGGGSEGSFKAMFQLAF